MPKLTGPRVAPVDCYRVRCLENGARVHEGPVQNLRRKSGSRIPGSVAVTTEDRAVTWAKRVSLALSAGEGCAGRQIKTQIRKKVTDPQNGDRAGVVFGAGLLQQLAGAGGAGRGGGGDNSHKSFYKLTLYIYQGTDF